MQAIKTTPDGIIVTIEVSPNSDKFQITGYNKWRKTLEVKIKSPPTKGKANKELIKEFSTLSKKPVEIISGKKSRQKTLKILDVDKNSFLMLLEKEKIEFD